MSFCHRRHDRSSVELDGYRGQRFPGPLCLSFILFCLAPSRSFTIVCFSRYRACLVGTRCGSARSAIAADAFELELSLLVLSSSLLVSVWSVLGVDLAACMVLPPVVISPAWNAEPSLSAAVAAMSTARGQGSPGTLPPCWCSHQLRLDLLNT